MTNYIYYDIDHSKLYTYDELVNYFVDRSKNDTDGEFAGYTFGQWLNACMTYNNGSLEKYELIYFDCAEDLEQFIQDLGYLDDDVKCASMTKLDSGQWVNDWDCEVYEVF